MTRLIVTRRPANQQNTILIPCATTGISRAAQDLSANAHLSTPDESELLV
jgi:hypothetical protein